MSETQTVMFMDYISIILRGSQKFPRLVVGGGNSQPLLTATRYHRHWHWTNTKRQ